MDNTTGEGEMTKPFEIFSGINGHVFATIYGRDNARLNAQMIAKEKGITIGVAEYGSDETEWFRPKIAAAFKPELSLTELASLEILDCRRDAEEFPESAEEFQAQAFGVFRLWLMATYKRGDAENDEIREMRDLATNWNLTGRGV